VIFAGSAGSVITMPGLPGQRLPKPVRTGVRRFWLLILTVTAHAATALRPAPRLADTIGRWLIFTSDDPSAAIRTARRDFLATDPRVLARTTLASVSDDGSKLASTLHVPALVLHGDRDKQISDDDIQFLLSRLPDGHLVTLPGAGHMLPLTDPATVAHYITEWTCRVTAAGTPRSRHNRRST
jgi:pimeloyl-ACP methyl ester carboxylesterase